MDSCPIRDEWKKKTDKAFSGIIDDLHALENRNRTVCDWTPVATPPLKLRKYYLVTAQVPGIFDIPDPSKLEVDKVWFDQEGWEREAVIAWAPLPEPYKPKAEAPPCSA
jgi:hypothetical protein